MKPLQNPGENGPFMEESCLRLRFYLIEYPLKDFDKKGDIRDGMQEICPRPIHPYTHQRIYSYTHFSFLAFYSDHKPRTSNLLYPFTHILSPSFPFNLMWVKITNFSLEKRKLQKI